MANRSHPRARIVTFDAEWYLRVNPDVPVLIRAGRVAGGREHFDAVGWREGRAPNRFFLEGWYRGRYPDVDPLIEQGRFSSGFDHYCQVGCSESRLPQSLRIDRQWYLETHLDAASALADGRVSSVEEHYLTEGAARGLDPHPVFSEAFYLDRYPEVAALVREGVFLCGYQHFLLQGRWLALAPHPKYDEQTYLQLNPDVELSVRLGRTATGWDHLVEAGLREGRKWQREDVDGARPPASAEPQRHRSLLARFDAGWYVKAYPDAAEAMRSGRCDSAADHYSTIGAPAGNDPNPFFSETLYLENNPDVAAGVMDGRWGTGFEHYVRYGHAEGRETCWLPIEPAWYRGRHPEANRALDRGEVKSLLEHYLLMGARAGLDPHPAFDEAWYLKNAPDAAEGVATGRFLSGYQHFVLEGRFDARPPHPAWDEEHYLSQHPDVRKAVAEGSFRDGYEHLVRLGLRERRIWRNDRGEQPERRAAFQMADVRLAEFLTSGRRLDLGPAGAPEVSVILVVHNRAELTFQCLESIGRSVGVRLETIVVDNQSRDRTKTMLERVDGVTVLRNHENVGFVRAANQGAAAATGELLLFLNNDTELLPSAIAAARARLCGTAGAGAIGGRVIGVDGRLQEAGCIVWRDGTTCGYGGGENPLAGEYLFPREVDYCSGVFLMTPRDLFEQLGGFDLRYAPAYYEEADYCYRLRRLGRTVVYEPHAALIHLGQGSLDESWHVVSFLESNRPVFRQAHREALSEALEPDRSNLIAARSRERFVARILYLDDRAPLRYLGSGFPRAGAIVRSLLELGYFVTYYATNPVPTDRRALAAELPEWGLELIDDRGRSRFLDFFDERPGFWDAIIVSRRHNLEWMLGLDVMRRQQRPPVVYDSEALFALRMERARQLLGDGVGPREDGAGSVDEEIALAARVEAVWSVSPQEAQRLAACCQRVRVVGHVPGETPSDATFHARSDLLFVGRLVEPWNPNVDGLRWFITEVLPRIAYRLGEPVTLHVAGRIGDDVDLPSSEHVRVWGRVDDLGPLYRTSRVFVAPSRFAAGIPLKVVEAAAAGLPVVSSELLARQLGWRAGEELQVGGDNDPEMFAEGVVEVYRDADLWCRLRDGALARVRSEYSQDALRAAISGTLEELLRPTDGRRVQV